MQLARLERMHQQNFIQAHQTFLKGRKESRKSGFVVGAHDAAVEGADTDRFGPPPRDAARAAAERQAATEKTAERGAAADALAPGAKNGIGVTRFAGDGFIAGVRSQAPRPNPDPPPEPNPEPDPPTL
jgi:hypothetical protein